MYSALKQCKVFKNSLPLENWLKCVEMTDQQKQRHLENVAFMRQLNGDIDDFVNDDIKDQGTSEYYNQLKDELMSKFVMSNVDPSHYDLLLKKRATIHIRELFKQYVTDDTLVIASSFEHISAERVLDNCKNLCKIDYEDEDSSLIYNIERAIELIKTNKYKNVFVYLIGTEFETGRRHDNGTYCELLRLIKDTNIPYIAVLDAVQEMFLYPRDYSMYHYVLGTVHAIYDKVDVGLLFINNNLVSKQEKAHFTGYKRCDVLEIVNWGIDFIQSRKPYIVMYNAIIDDCIDHSLIKGFKQHKSAPNFYSLYGQPTWLTNKECLDFIDKKFIQYAKSGDPGVNVEISYHKNNPELFIRLRPQTLMLDFDEIIVKLNYFYKNYTKLLKMAEMLS